MGTRLRYERVIWDFDGVLVDSRLEAWRAASELLALLGITVSVRSQDEFRRFFTGGDLLSDPDRATLRATHRLIMRSRADLLDPHPCLALVERLSVPSEIMTSGLEAFAKSVLGDREKLFAAIRGNETGPKGSLLQAAPPASIFVTDTIGDIARCRDRGLDVIAVGWGYDSLPALRNARPDYLVESPIQLESLFKGFNLLDDV